MIPYESPIAYVEKRIHAAAVYCSDGRVGEHFDDFLYNGLKLPRYDRIALPGGPACMAGYAEARLEEQGVLDELKFLIDAHGLERVVLIAHEGCAFYTARLKAPFASMARLQHADLVRAAYFIRHQTALEAVDAYFARRTEKGIQFDPVALD